MFDPGAAPKTKPSQKQAAVITQVFRAGAVALAAIAFFVGMRVTGTFLGGVLGIFACTVPFGVFWMIYALAVGVKGFRSEMSERRRRG